MNHLIHFNKDMSGYGAQQVSLCLLKASPIPCKYYVSLSSVETIHKGFYEEIIINGIKPLSLTTFASIFFICRLCISGNSVVVHGHSSKSLLPFLFLSIIHPIFPRLSLVFTNHGYLRSSRVLCIIQSLAFRTLSLLGSLVTTVERPDESSLFSRLLFCDQQYIPNPLPFVTYGQYSPPVNNSDLGFLSSDNNEVLVRIGLYGGLSRAKNPLFVVDVLRQILTSDKFVSNPGLRLYLSVIGDGPLLAQMVQSLSHLCDLFPRLTFEFHGYASGRELESLLSRLDFALFPSIYDSYNISVRHTVSHGVLSLTSEAIPWSVPPVVPVGLRFVDAALKITCLPLDPYRWSQCVMRLLDSDPLTLSILRASALDALQSDILNSFDSLSKFNEIYARTICV